MELYKELTNNLSSASWWLSVVVVGLIVSVAGYFVAKLVERIVDKKIKERKETQLKNIGKSLEVSREIVGDPIDLILYIVNAAWDFFTCFVYGFCAFFAFSYIFVAVDINIVFSVLLAVVVMAALINSRRSWSKFISRVEVLLFASFCRNCVKTGGKKCEIPNEPVPCVDPKS